MYPLSSTAHHVCPCSYPVSTHHPSSTSPFGPVCFLTVMPLGACPSCLHLSQFPPWPSHLAYLSSFLPLDLSPPGYLHPWSQPPYQGKKMCFGPAAPAQWSMAQVPSVGVLGGWGMNLFSFSGWGMHPPFHSLWVPPSPGSWIPFSPNLQKGGCQLGTPEGWRAQCLLRSEFRG